MAQTQHTNTGELVSDSKNNPVIDATNCHESSKSTWLTSRIPFETSKAVVGPEMVC
jgi:hypothetical protein